MKESPDTLMGSGAWERSEWDDNHGQQEGKDQEEYLSLISNKVELKK